MNKLIAIAIVSLASLTAFSQNNYTNKNIFIRFVVEDAVAGTNATTIRFNGNGTKRDLMVVNGAYWWQSEMIRGQQPGSTNSLEVMIKDRVKALMEADGLAYNAGQQAILLSKLAAILNTQPELLSDAQKNQLASIAELLP